MSRLPGALRLRLVESPVALRAHALLIVAAALLAPDHGASMWWSGAVIVGMVSWALLRGSLFAWFVQLVGIAISLLGLFGVLQRVTEGLPGLSVFVPPGTLALVAALLLGGLFLLLLPSARGYCLDSTGAPRRTSGFALAALLVGTFPATSLSLEPRLPSRGSASYDTPNLVLVGTDETLPATFYVGGRKPEVCMVILQPRSSGRSCTRLQDLDGAMTRLYDDWGAGLVSKEVVAVEVRDDEGVGRRAELLRDDRSPANVYYFTGYSTDDVEVRGYDARGEVLFSCGPGDFC